MAIVSFSNSKVTRTYTSPHSMNAWAILQTTPTSWQKVQTLSTDGVTNMFVLLNAAKATGRTLSGSYEDSNGQLYTLYLN